MTARKMTIVRTPGTDNRPMVKITNRLLSEMGFEIGTAIEVSYQRGIIIIKKTLNHEQLQGTSGNDYQSTASGKIGDGKGDEYAIRKPSNSSGIEKALL